MPTAPDRQHHFEDAASPTFAIRRETEPSCGMPDEQLGKEQEGPKGLARAANHLVEQLINVGVNGFGPFKSAAESAAEASRERSPEEAVKALIHTHVLMAAGQGFVTNVGGLAALPISLPANVGAAYLVQTHLAASIAHIHGHDSDEEQVRAAVLLCLLGNAGTEVVKKAGVEIGQKLALSMIDKLPIAVIRKINQRVGFTLLAKHGTKRATVTLAKGVPLVGGVVGGSIDAAATRAVGAFAGKFFSEPADDARTDDL